MIALLSLAFGLFVLLLVLPYTTRGWRQEVSRQKNVTETDTVLMDRLRSHVYTLSHEIGDRTVRRYDNLQQSQRYIVGQLQSYGYDTRLQPYFVAEKEVNNIIAAVKGSIQSEKIVIVGAHYDTYHNPGADDNASGISMLLELARGFSGKQPAYTIEFVGFVNEEPPYFKTSRMGSRVYTASLKEHNRNIHAAIILESIGYFTNAVDSQWYPPFFGPFYPNQGNFLAFVGNHQSRWLVNKAASSFISETSFPVQSIATFPLVKGVDFSDNWSFWQEEYPAVMVSDTALYRNPNYHQQSDTYETLDYTSMTEIYEGLQEVLQELANQ